jgi:two-component system, chemotaxis family, protein-glutamate methylesterase/glutaminase
MPTTTGSARLSSIVAIGGSAGALRPLLDVVRQLPPDGSVAVFVVLHTGQRIPSRLADILSRGGPLTARQAEHGEAVAGGRIYVAPPGRHLMVSDGTVVLSAGPRVNRHRPAIDVTFASFASWAGQRCTAVMLSGVLDDGAVGAALVSAAGGVVLVQEPASADFPSMPQATLTAVPDARGVTPAELGSRLARRVREQEAAGQLTLDPSTAERPPEEASMTMADSADPFFVYDDEYRPARLACPDCGGGLAEVRLPTINYYRCHVGHQYSPQTLAAAQADVTERRLWAAVAALEEQANVLRQLAAAGGVGHDADEVARRAAGLRSRVREWSTMPDDAEAAP